MLTELVSSVQSRSRMHRIMGDPKRQRRGPYQPGPQAREGPRRGPTRVAVGVSLRKARGNCERPRKGSNKGGIVRCVFPMPYSTPSGVAPGWPSESVGCRLRLFGFVPSGDLATSRKPNPRPGPQARESAKNLVEPHRGGPTWSQAGTRLSAGTQENGSCQYLMAGLIRSGDLC